MLKDGERENSLTREVQGSHDLAPHKIVADDEDEHNADESVEEKVNKDVRKIY
jgi:hypothetical protein